MYGVHVFIAVCKWMHTCDTCAQRSETTLESGPYCQFCVSLFFTAVYQASKFFGNVPVSTIYLLVGDQRDYRQWINTPSGFYVSL